MKGVGPSRYHAAGIQVRCTHCSGELFHQHKALGRKGTMTKDYAERIDEFWPTLVRAWDEFRGKPPVLMKTVLSLFFGCLLLDATGATPQDQSRKKMESEGAAILSRTDAGPTALLELDTYAAEQDGLLDEFCRTSVQAFKDRSAYLLSELWRAGMLKDEIKQQLVRDHYRMVLFQVYGNDGAPNVVVRGFQTFPFPDVWTEFTPTLYRNGQVEWSPGKAQKAHVMSINNSTITSQIGGALNHGDVLQYRIVLRQSGDATVGQMRPWEVSVWSNRLLVQGIQKSERSVK